MFQHLLTNGECQPCPSNKNKTVYLIQNGNPEHTCCMVLTPGKQITKCDIAEQSEKIWWPTKYKNIRIFSIDSIELFDEDLLYLKNNERIYVSRGEDFDSNRNFGEYQIIKQLGEGGFGTVSLARNKITGEKAAIKVLKTNKASSSSCLSIDMIFRQAENLKSLSHPNIVKIINCYALRNMKFVVVMEYLEGGELREILKSKIKFNEEEAKIYFRQIIAAVSYCHRQGIIHKDLKLENILLSKQNNIKVTDFGISGVVDRFNPELDWGTLKYMPPEILNKKQKINAFAGDIWACGIILFYMLVGHLPFNGNTSAQITHKIINCDVEFPRACEISPKCKQLIVRMLQKNHKSRITMSQIQNHCWVAGGISINQNIKGSEQGSSDGNNQLTLNTMQSAKKLTQSDSIKVNHSRNSSLKQPIKSRKVVKKNTIPIPKRLEKQKNEVLQELNGYRMTRKLFKSQSKCFPELRSTQNRMTKHVPQNSKFSHAELEAMKKSLFKPL